MISFRCTECDEEFYTFDAAARCHPGIGGVEETELVCLEASDACEGPVEMWYSGGVNGRSWPRCRFHGERRLERFENSIERYADSDVAPDWFDPANAGERWDDDY